MQLRFLRCQSCGKLHEKNLIKHREQTRCACGGIRFIAPEVPLWKQLVFVVIRPFYWKDLIFGENGPCQTK